MTDSPKKDYDWPIGLWIGLSPTALIFVSTVLYLSKSEVASWWDKPEQFGTFIAGVSGALAFLWLVVATFLQMEELRLQRRELRSSREAQQHQAKETEALVEHSISAVEVARNSLSEQQKQWKEQQLDKLIDLVAKRIAAAAPGTALMRSGTSAPLLFGHFEADDGPDDIIRKPSASLKLYMPYQATDALSHDERVKRDIVKLLKAIRAIEWDAMGLDKGAGVVERSYPSIEARMDLNGLGAFKTRLEALEQWMKTKGI